MVRYEYDFMPKGIITRLIVEMHGLIYRPHPPTPSPNLGEGEPEIFETPLGNFTIDRPHPPTPSANLGESEPEDSKSPLSETWERRLGGEGKSDLVWRDGVLLTNGYAIAEVIENYHQREIRIRIVGREKARLLEPIRHELWKIHSSYDNRLKFQEFIPCNCVQCKGNPDPHFYTFENLRRRLDNFRYEVECEKSYVMVNVRGLMDDFPDYSRPGERERFSGKAYDDRMDDSRSQNSSYHFYFEGNKMTQDSPKTNNFNAPMSGVIGSDNAQVSNNQFIQTNNANTA